MLTSAAWAAPAIILSTSTPAFATSQVECDVTVTGQVTTRPASSANLTSGFEAHTGTFVVPAGVTQLQFQLAGGGGGVNTNLNANNMPGGPGDLISGVLHVTPGMTLDYVVGNGGIGVNGLGSQTPASTTIKGGGGFGNGGDMVTGPSSHNARYAAGTGGGGLAILVNGVPLVVAGGGGGAGGGVMLGEWTWRLDAAGGRGGLVAGAGTRSDGYWTPRPETVYNATGGRGASGATPGVRAGSGGSSGWSGDGSNGAGLGYGVSGKAPGTVGGDGGAGRLG